jgi:hypothetical protein
MDMRTVRWLASAAIAVVASVAGQALAQVQPIPGEVVALEGDELRIRSKSGDVTRVKLAPSARVMGRAPATWADVKAGAYLGATAAPDKDGTLVATEVHIFPESMRGTGEGHRPMDAPGKTMTNATVSNVATASAAKSTMTNATVAGVQGAANSRRMTVTYKGGEKTIVVPPDAPVVLVEPGDRALLAPGTHVIVYASRQPDGSWTSERVSAGKKGIVPPI